MSYQIINLVGTSDDTPRRGHRLRLLRKGRVQIGQLNIREGRSATVSDEVYETFRDRIAEYQAAGVVRVRRVLPEGGFEDLPTKTSVVLMVGNTEGFDKLELLKSDVLTFHPEGGEVTLNENSTVVDIDLSGVFKPGPLSLYPPEPDAEEPVVDDAPAPEPSQEPDAKESDPAQEDPTPSVEDTTPTEDSARKRARPPKRG